MRIAHVTEDFLPNTEEVETQVSQLAAKQTEIGHEVRVLTSVKGKGAADEKLSYEVRRLGGLATLEGKSVDPRTAGRFAADIANFNPDVVHVHLVKPSSMIRNLLGQLNDAEIPVVVTIHSLWSPFLAGPTYGRLVRPLRSFPIVWTGV